MQTLKTRILLMTFAICSITMLSSCNVRGLFTKYEDDPAWVDPNADADQADGAATAGGPGKAVYGRICASCHKSGGEGANGSFPPLKGSAIAQGDPRKPIAIVLHGFQGAIERGGVKYNGQMASWKDQLSDQEIADVLTYVRSSFGNSAAAVTKDEVAAMRDETKNQASAYTQATLP